MQASTRLSAAIRAINEGHPDEGLHAAYLRNTAPFEEQLYALEHTTADCVKKLTGIPVPSNWSEVWKPPQKVPPITKIQQSLNWFLAVAQHYRENLVKHSALSSELYRSVLAGQVAEARNVLKKHQATLGYSLWGMAWFVYLTEEDSGARSRHQFLDVLGREQDTGSAVFFASTLSLLTDNSLPNDHCVKAVRAKINKSTAQVRAFLDLFFLDHANDKLPITDVLKYFDFVSVIDRYEIFNRMTVHAASEKAQDAQKCVRVLHRLQEICPSDGKQYLAECFNENISFTLSTATKSLLQGWDCYVCSDYAGCLNIMAEMAESDANLFVVHDLFVKSEIYLQSKSGKPPSWSDNSPIAVIHRDLRSIYTRSDDTDAALASMVRLATRLRIPTLSSAIKAFVASHTNDIVDERVASQAAYSLGCHGPRNWEASAKRSYNLNYLGRLRNADAGSTASAFFYTAEDTPDQLGQIFPDLDEARKCFFAGISSARQNNDLSAKTFLRRFLTVQRDESTSPLSLFAIEEARRVLMRSLCNHGDALGLLDLIVEVLLDRSPSFRRLSFDIAYRICRQAPNLFCHHIGYPILAALAADSAHKISFALRRFLGSCGVKIPTQLIGSVAISDDEKALLFMRVCSLDVLQSIGELRSLDELEAERLELLRWVGQTVPKESRAVETELLRITQQAQLREALDNIDSSRVVLNLPALREAEHERFANVYYSYRAQKELEIGQDMMNRARAAARSIIGDTDGTMALYVTTSADLDEAFQKAFRFIRDQFINSAQFGLDACLSARVRHGYVVDHLRRPLVENKLAISRQSLDDDLFREYWKERLGVGHLGPLIEDIFQIMLVATERTDSLAQTVKNEWVQCITESRGHIGIFDYRFPNEKMWRLKHREINQEPSLELFLDLIFDTLVERTHFNLKQVRRRLEVELLPNLDSIIKDALASLVRLPLLPREALNLLQGAYTACRTQIEAAVAEMKRWFLESRSTLMRDADPSLACRTAVGMAERLNPGHRGRIRYIETASEFKIKGRFFTSIVHIAHFLLENAVKHSGLPSNLSQTELVIRTEQNMLIFETRNAMPSVASATDAAVMIATAIKALSLHLDHAKIAREGGSGLAKILSTIIYEFKGLNPRIKCSADGHWLKVSVACQAVSIMSL